MTSTCFQIHPRDNVATLLADAAAGADVALIGGGADAQAEAVTLAEAIVRGHKAALSDLAPGDPIVKYGVRIGHATRAIRRGQWVHLHNCASDQDERSAAFDPQTGEAVDMQYE